MSAPNTNHLAPFLKDSVLRLLRWSLARLAVCVARFAAFADRRNDEAIHAATEAQAAYARWAAAGANLRAVCPSTYLESDQYTAHARAGAVLLDAWGVACRRCQRWNEVAGGSIALGQWLLAKVVAPTPPTISGWGDGGVTICDTPAASRKVL